MKEVKQWIKDHKKEIIICVMAAGGTALYFIRKEKKIKGVKDASEKSGLQVLFKRIRNSQAAYTWVDYSGKRGNGDG